MSGADKEMNKHSPIKPDSEKKRSSLLERASKGFGFDDAVRSGSSAAPLPLVPEDVAKMEARKAAAKAAKERSAAAVAVSVATPTVAPQIPPQQVYIPMPAHAGGGAQAGANGERRLNRRADDRKHRATAAERAAAPRLHETARRPVQNVDRKMLETRGFITPGGSANTIAEEFRLVKRTLLRNMNGSAQQPAIARGERILVTSANPNEGKTFCSVNLALSMAAEADHEVLLVDADFAKPSVLSTLGLSGKDGFMDALADPSISIEDLIIPTDVSNLSVLPAGNQTSRDSEYLSSDRMAEVLDKLTANAPHRIIIFDSPPVLAASPAAVICAQVGQTVVVVRADKTNETALREAVGLLGPCEHLQLLLNGTRFSPGGRRYGTYYGYGE